MKLPVISTVKNVVIGCGYAALSAAISCAGSEKSETILICRETFLGYETSFLGRYYLPLPVSDSIKPFFGNACLCADLSQNNYVPIHPDKHKTGLEDMLTKSGVQILYGAESVGAYTYNNDNIAVVITGKFGRQAVLCEHCYDYRISAENCFPKWMKRTVMLSEVDSTVQSELQDQFNNDVKLYPGAFNDKHVVLEVTTEIDRFVLALSDEKRNRILENKSGLINSYLQYFTAKNIFDTLEQMIKHMPSMSNAVIGRLGFMPFVSIKSIEELIADGKQLNRRLKPEPIYTDIETVVGINDGIYTYTRKEENKSVFLNQYSFIDIDFKQNNMTDKRSYDIIVCGGGTSGAPAALAAKSDKSSVAIIEMNPVLGGTSTIGGVNSYWFGNRGFACNWIDRATETLHRRLNQPYPGFWWSRFDVWNADIKAFVILELCINIGIDVYLNTLMVAALTYNNSINGIIAAFNGNEQYMLGKIVIDGTGDGDVAAFAGADFTYGSEKDGITYWASLAQYTSPSGHKNNFTGTVYTGDLFDYTRFIMTNRRRGDSNFDHGAYVAPRESRHIKGRSTITLLDQLLNKQYEDTVHTCFSNYDPKGKCTSDYINFGLLPPNLMMQIPFSALLPEFLGNMIVVGKAFSATHDSIPGLRMQPDLIEIGWAAGKIAAYCVENGKKPHEICADDIKKILDINIDTPELSDSVNYEQIIANLTGSEPFEWIDMNVREAVTKTPPHVLLAVANSADVIGLLRREYGQSYEKKAFLLAKLLLWHYDDTGISLILSHIKDELKHGGLPQRKASMSFCQLLPDHGVMPEIVYEMNLLANSTSTSKRDDIFKLFEEICRRLCAAERDYMDVKSGIYCYIESICFVSERLGDERFAPLLKTIERFTEFETVISDQNSSGILTERLLILYLNIQKALYQLGDEKANIMLESLSQSPVKQVAFSAAMKLKAPRNVDCD